MFWGDRMLLYIIRHGDPIYDPDSLTEKGQRQAEALGRRLCVNGLDRAYVSPMIRAQQTAAPACKALGITPVIKEWMSEQMLFDKISVPRDDGKPGKRWCWERQNTDFKNNETINDPDAWKDHPIFYGAPVEDALRVLAGKSDELLEELGYRREGSIYRILKPSEERVAAFCHHGFGMTWLSQLLQIPPHLFWGSFNISHSGVTILEFENHENGITAPRCLMLSDLSHVYADGLPMEYNNVIKI